MAISRHHYGTVYVGTHIRFICSVTLSSSLSPDDVTNHDSASHSNIVPSCLDVQRLHGEYYCGTEFTPDRRSTLWCIAMVDGPNIQTANSSNTTYIDVRRKFTFFYLSIFG